MRVCRLLEGGPDDGKQFEIDAKIQVLEWPIPTAELLIRDETDPDDAGKLTPRVFIFIRRASDGVDIFAERELAEKLKL